MDDKFEVSIAILVKSLEFKNDIPKFADYIRKHKEYFPNITEETLEQMIKNDEKIKNEKIKNDEKIKNELK